MKNAAGKSATLAKPGNAKAQFITRAEARRRAERHVINQMFKGATVRDGAEVASGHLHPEQLDGQGRVGGV